MLAGPPPRWDSPLRGAWGWSQATGHGCRPPTPRGLLALEGTHSSSTNSVPAAHSPLGSGVTTPSWGPPLTSVMLRADCLPFQLFRERFESSSKEAWACQSAVLALLSRQLCPSLPGYDIRIELMGGINWETGTDICILLYTYIYPRIPLYTTHTAIYPCILLYKYKYCYIPTHTPRYLRILLYTYIYCYILYIPLYTHAYHCIPTHTTIYLYILLYTYTYHYIPTHTAIYL